MRGALLSLLRGVVLGVAVILPGLSGGTVALIMGIYTRLVDDFSHFRWRPHLPLAVGVAAGILGGARLIAALLTAVPDLLSAYLLGLIMAGGWRLFIRHPRPGPAGMAAWFVGIGFALALAGEPLSNGGGDPSLSPATALLGGGVAGTAMMLPGVSGSAMMVLLGLYADILAAVNTLDLPVLAVFGIGAGLGMFVVARLMSLLLARFPAVTLLFLAGLVLGSARAVLPGGSLGQLSIAEAALTAAGVISILAWREKDG